MTDIFKHAERLPVKYSHSDTFDELYGLLDMHERDNEGFMHDIAVATAVRAEKIAIGDLMNFLREKGYSMSVNANGTAELYHDIEHGGNPTCETLVKMIKEQQ